VTEKTITAYEDLQFVPLAEGSPVEVAVLWGNPETGPAAVVVRLPEGYREPWHSHTTTYHSVLIKGEFQTQSKDEGVTVSEVYGAGTYVVQPGGAVHSEINAGSGELVAFVYFDGPVDFVLDE
jgi:quercetin dioxygenase-like cupin family protein